MISAVLLDIDGVLLDSLKANWQFFTNVFTRTGYQSPTLEEYKSMYNLTMVEVLKRVTGLEDGPELERVQAAAMDRSGMYPYELVKMPADAQPTVKLLAEKYLLGLVTSRVRVGIYSIPQLANLESMIDVTIAFEDTVQHKPSPEPLLLAAEKLRVAPEHCVYVGDAETDCMAARAAGMKIVMYNNRSVHGADGYIEALRELPAVVAEL